MKRRRASSVRKSVKDKKRRQANATGDGGDTHKVAMRLLQKSSLSAFNVELGFFNSLYEPRTLTILLCLLVFVNLVYLPYFSRCLPATLNVNLYDKISKQSATTQVLHGVWIACIAFLAYGCTQLRDSVMVRPHPVVWRFVHAMGLIYFLSLFVLIPIEAPTARKLIHNIHPTLGATPNTQTYGEDCRLLDGTSLINAVYDEFMLAHLFGWVVKALIIRDWYILFLLGFGFEVLEITFQYQLKNFNECWWDHLILDLFGANMIGMVFGMQLVKLLKSREYDWVGNTISKLKSRKKKLIRVIFQLTPYHYEPFEWKMFASPIHFCSILAMIIPFLASEVCFFYIKHHLWIQSTSPVYLCCLAIRSLLSAHAVSEWYTFNFREQPHVARVITRNAIERPLTSSQRRLGQNCWLILATTSAELILTLKWNYLEYGLMLPPLHICLAWLVTFACVAGWLVLRFFLDAKREKKGHRMNDYQWVLGVAMLPLLYVFAVDTYRTAFFHPPLNISKGISLMK